MNVKIDHHYILEIAGDDCVQVLHIIDDFECESMSLIDELVGIVNRQPVNSANLSRLLHKFKGSAVSLGFITLGDFIVDMDTWDEKNWQDFGADEMRELVSESTRLAKRLLNSRL